MPHSENNAPKIQASCKTVLTICVLAVVFPFVVYLCSLAFAWGCAFFSVPCGSLYEAGFYGFFGACGVYFFSYCGITLIVDSCGLVRARSSKTVAPAETASQIEP